jgi:hypothetical protein
LSLAVWFWESRPEPAKIAALEQRLKARLIAGSEIASKNSALNWDVKLVCLLRNQIFEPAGSAALQSPLK